MQSTKRLRSATIPRSKSRDEIGLFALESRRDEWVKSLHLPLRSFKHPEARTSVLLEALIANLIAPGQWVSYSCRRIGETAAQEEVRFAPSSKEEAPI
jgi:hypothetical protein